MPVVPWTAIYPDGPAGAAIAGGASAEALNENADYPGMPSGATPIHKDIQLTVAGTSDIWIPNSDRRFVLISAFISSDAAGRVALVDDADTQNQRPVDQRLGVNGGSSPNLIPVPYVSKNVGNRLRVVSTVTGNVAVRVSGWERG